MPLKEKYFVERRYFSCVGEVNDERRIEVKSRMAVKEKYFDVERHYSSTTIKINDERRIEIKSRMAVKETLAWNVIIRRQQSRSKMKGELR
ncbi:hypothetical protein AVEN_22561-1 [Araneus ventricosus]|uniref:Uncharacterized protein n=1 Tax=Araneus ventricosus TaxID=182803 RepID=A0A4Y2E4Z6_ARAVE|nr:hypothetical protein AVEN_22561-1 [Araneus ventricosus]